MPRTAGPFLPRALLATTGLLLAPGLAASGLAAQPARGAPSATLAPAPDQRLAREIYRELVEINTVDSVGSVTRAAEAMARRFRAAGFPAQDVQLLVPADKPTKGNLVVRYRGRGGPQSQKPVLLLAHLDVVAANRSDWPRDPFVLHEENGYFLGRGTADDKAMAAVFVANLLRYKQEGWVPARDLILVLTADEEGGDGNGVSWLTVNHRALIDAAYAINEGEDAVLGRDGPLYLGVQAAEKTSMNYTLAVSNPGGHSSMPRPDNAIYQLADALSRVARYRFPVALNDVTRSFFSQTAARERPEMAAAMRAIVSTPSDSGAAATLAASALYDATLRTTCVATRLTGGHAYNALPQLATANVNCRIVPTSSAEEVKAALARIVADTGVAITYTLPPTSTYGTVLAAAPPRPIDPILLAAITALTRRMFGDVPVIPIMSRGATDGRFLRGVGIPTYGVAGMFLAPGEANMHGRDEKMRVKSFYEGQAFLYQLVKDVAGGGGPRA